MVGVPLSIPVAGATISPGGKPAAMYMYGNGAHASRHGMGNWTGIIAVSATTLMGSA